jgi:hypothetical protein
MKFKEVASKEPGERREIWLSGSPWRSPIRAIKKPNGDVKLASSLMRLNDLAKKNTYRLPNTKRIIGTVAGSRRFPVIDPKEGY